MITLKDADPNMIANIWLGLQADYDMQKERSNKSFVERLRSIRQIAAVL